MFKFLIAAVILLLIWLFYVIGKDNLRAMEACQQTHSYNTCAWDNLR